MDLNKFDDNLYLLTESEDFIYYVPYPWFDKEAIQVEGKCFLPFKRIIQVAADRDEQKSKELDALEHTLEQKLKEQGVVIHLSKGLFDRNSNETFCGIESGINDIMNLEKGTIFIEDVKSLSVKATCEVCKANFKKEMDGSAVIETKDERIFNFRLSNETEKKMVLDYMDINEKDKMNDSGLGELVDEFSDIQMRAKEICDVIVFESKKLKLFQVIKQHTQITKGGRKYVEVISFFYKEKDGKISEAEDCFPSNDTDTHSVSWLSESIDDNNSANEIDHLESLLKTAIEQEDYETCVKLRKQLNALIDNSNTK